jgi:hypothetical protein
MKKSTKQEWIPTRDRRLAAACGTLGMVVRLSKMVVAASGVRQTRFLLGKKSVCGRHDAQSLLHHWKTGRLVSMKPTHDFVAVMTGMLNRDMLLDCMNKGARLALREAHGGRFFVYVAGDMGLPGVRPGQAVIETGDLKMAAALATVGFPLLKLEGGPGRWRFFLPAGLPAAAGRPPVDGVALLRAWRESPQALDGESPFALAAWGMHNRERLLDAEKAEVDLVLLRKPASVKSALLRDDATGKAWDKAVDFLDA